MGQYLFGDQYARLEAVRAYINAAVEIVEEIRKYENRQSGSDLADGIDELKGDLKCAYYSCQGLIEHISTETAIEEAERVTMPPHVEPDPFPSNPPTLDEPFGDLI
jgi:hypothetical protein